MTKGLMMRIPRTPIEWPVDRPLLPPGKGVKFAVVDSVTGNRSSTWLVRTSRNKDDVYLLELRTGGTWKVSHHNEGGIWRIAETSEAATSVKSKREVVDHWHWPSPEHGGWREGVGVLIPSVYLRPDPDPLPPSVVQIPRFAEHAELAVKLLFEDKGASGCVFPPSFPVAVLERAHNLGRVYVLAQAGANLGASQHAVLAEMCEKARAARPAAVNYNRAVGVLRMRSQRALVDLALD